MVPFFPLIRSGLLGWIIRGRRVRRVFSTYFGTERGGVRFLAYIQPQKDFLLKKHTLAFISVFPTPLLKIPVIIYVPAQLARAS